MTEKNKNKTRLHTFAGKTEMKIGKQQNYQITNGKWHEEWNNELISSILEFKWKMAKQKTGDIFFNCLYLPLSALEIVNFK